MHADPDGLYARLGLPPTASAEAIGAAYRRRARVLHPDIPHTGNTEAFLALRAAYEILSDPDRRRAYDRSARPAPEPSFAPPPQPVADLSPPPSNRFALWAAFLVGSAALAAFAMLRLAQGPTAGLPDHPGPPPAPWVRPVALPRAHPAGRADHYVLPGLGPLDVMQPRPPAGALRRVATLAPFTPVRVLSVDPARHLAEIRLAGSAVGFVAPDRLARGGATAAHAAFCADRAGPPPLSGQTLAARGHGRGAITFVNQDLEPAVIKLRDSAGRLVRAVFLAPGASLRLRGLPGRMWEVEFAVGELWSRPCRYFAAGERAERFPRPLAAGSLVRLPPDLPPAIQPYDIPDRVFARP